MPRSTLSERFLKREERRRARQGQSGTDTSGLSPLPTRAECRAGPRPCPHARCRYHLMADVSQSGGLKLARPDGDVAGMDVTCSLDLAEHGRMSLDQVAQLLDITRERVRQLEERALERLRDALVSAGLTASEVQEHLGRPIDWARQVAAQPSQADDAELPSVQFALPSARGRIVRQPSFPLESQDRPPRPAAETSLRRALGLKKGDASWLREENLSDWMSSDETP